MIPADVEIELDKETLGKAKTASQRMSMSLEQFLGRCLDEGYRVVFDAVKKWKDTTGSAGYADELRRTTREYERARADRIAVEGKAATLNFMAYEAFCRVGTKLMAYSGSRSTAKDLQKRLKESKSEFDISSGELAEFKVLADRYLFRKKGDKENGKASQDEV